MDKTPFVLAISGEHCLQSLHNRDSPADFDTANLSPSERQRDDNHVQSKLGFFSFFLSLTRVTVEGKKGHFQSDGFVRAEVVFVRHCQWLNQEAQQNHLWHAGEGEWEEGGPEKEK